jgi:hypothetical protein
MSSSGPVGRIMSYRVRWIEILCRIGQTRNAWRIVEKKSFGKSLLKKTERDEWFNVRQIVVTFREQRWMDESLVSFMIMSFAAYSVRIRWTTLVHSPSIRCVEICTDYYRALPVQ